ncbi:MAG: glycosyltransferase [bacterium]|nr:glycosyltransferase [bacterium]
MNFIFIANAAVGNGLSGSDRIFIELARRWVASGHRITTCVWEDGYKMCQRENLNSVSYNKWYIGNLKNLPFILGYFYRILSGIWYSIIFKMPYHDGQTYIYSCSDFWQDSLPASILKLRFPKSKFIGSYYLTAPNPLVGFYEGKRLKLPSLKSTLYWLQQKPIHFILTKMADFVFVTSEPDALKFTNTVVVKGGVVVDQAKVFTPTFRTDDKQYEAIFQGRFHPQKGVLEMIEIWNLVIKHKPKATLNMIGDGPLFKECQSKINYLNLSKNIILKGYIFDGDEKFQLFKESKIVVHPAVYDSGGMAAAEAMAWGVPGVSFDLEALKTYYPKGMIKVPFGDFQEFAFQIIKLLDDPSWYSQNAHDARDLVLEEWDWDKRAAVVLSQL